MSLKAVDFFCGIGGVTKGFLNAGIDVIAGIDIDPSCKETYEKNNIRFNGSSAKYLNEDITTLDISKIKELISNEDKLVVIGCAPCQPFTIITKNLEGRKKERNLLEAFGDVILELEPEYIFLENVQGLGFVKNRHILFAFLEKLAPTYKIEHKVINAADYGVPQNRKRMILFGKKNDVIDFPLATHGHGKLKHVLLKDVIGHLPHLNAGEKHSKLITHVCSNLSNLCIERLIYQTNPGDGMEKWPEHLKINSRRNKEYKGHKDVYSRAFWDKTSPTLTTKFISISNGRFAHPEQHRGFSILEGLLIQTFPENFYMESPFIRYQARQIGNAVPVKLAEAFALKILEVEGGTNQRLLTDKLSLCLK